MDKRLADYCDGVTVVSPRSYKDFVTRSFELAQQDAPSGSLSGQKLETTQQPPAIKHRSLFKFVIVPAAFLLGFITAGAIGACVEEIPRLEMRATAKKVRRMLGAETEPIPVAKLLLNPASITGTKLWSSTDLARELSFRILTTDLDREANQLIFGLEGNNRLVVDRDRAVLEDSEHHRLGDILFRTPGMRNLGKQKAVMLPQQQAPVQGPIAQYRAPFFGYGFPLLGTESQFPQGYGGNTVSQLGAEGLLGGDLPPNSVVAPVGALPGIPPVSASGC